MPEESTENNIQELETDTLAISRQHYPNFAICLEAGIRIENETPNQPFNHQLVFILKLLAIQPYLARGDDLDWILKAIIDILNPKIEKSEV